MVSAQSGGLEYEMVSYSGGDQSAETPFFNLSFLNQKTFTINYVNFSRGFQSLFDFMIGASIATAVILFVYHAFQGIVGGGNAGERKKANDGMVNAVTGLMIILSTWLIINTINPDLIRLSIFQGLDQVTTNQPTTGEASAGTLRSGE